MERLKAFTLLGLSENATSDDITDALDQAVFKVRDQFLRGAVIPKLAASRVERCVLLSDVAQTLGVVALGAPATVPQHCRLPTRWKAWCAAMWKTCAGAGRRWRHPRSGQRGPAWPHDGQPHRST